MELRKVQKIVQAHHQREGAGFLVRRPLPTEGNELVDPFLLIDEMGPVDYAPGEAVGAPDHPHRGFETVTYSLAGEFEHEDSAGHKGVLRPGDVQWMTAGAGIVHSEMPSKKVHDEGGRVHGFQIWINLPSRLKMTRPRYQELPSAKIPVARSADGKARVKVIAGEALGVKAAIDTHTPVVYQDWSLDEGGEARIDVPATHNAMVYVFEGAAKVGGERIGDGQLAVLGPGDAVQLRGVEGGGRMLLLAGLPHNERVARYGPFVMNSDQELVQAFRDFQSGRMGEITRSASVG